MRRLLVVVAAATLFSVAAATSGRAGVRVEVGGYQGFSIRAYVEQVVWKIDDLEISAGVDVRYPEALVTPYSAVNWYSGQFWVSIEMASDVNLGSAAVAFRVTVAAGYFW